MSTEVRLCELSDSVPTGAVAVDVPHLCVPTDSSASALAELSVCASGGSFAFAEHMQQVPAVRNRVILWRSISNKLHISDISLDFTLPKPASAVLDFGNAVILPGAGLHYDGKGLLYMIVPTVTSLHRFSMPSAYEAVKKTSEHASNAATSAFLVPSVLSHLVDNWSPSQLATGQHRAILEQKNSGTSANGAHLPYSATTHVDSFQRALAAFAYSDGSILIVTMPSYNEGTIRRSPNASRSGTRRTAATDAFDSGPTATQQWLAPPSSSIVTRVMTSFLTTAASARSPSRVADFKWDLFGAHRDNAGFLYLLSYDLRLRVWCAETNDFIVNIDLTNVLGGSTDAVGHGAHTGPPKMRICRLRDLTFLAVCATLNDLPKVTVCAISRSTVKPVFSDTLPCDTLPLVDVTFSTETIRLMYADQTHNCRAKLFQRGIKLGENTFSGGWNLCNAVENPKYAAGKCVDEIFNCDMFTFDVIFRAVKVTLSKSVDLSSIKYGDTAALQRLFVAQTKLSGQHDYQDTSSTGSDHPLAKRLWNACVQYHGTGNEPVALFACESFSCYGTIRKSSIQQKLSSQERLTLLVASRDICGTLDIDSIRRSVDVDRCVAVCKLVRGAVLDWSQVQRCADNWDELVAIAGQRHLWNTEINLTSTLHGARSDLIDASTHVIRVLSSCVDSFDITDCLNGSSGDQEVPESPNRHRRLADYNRFLASEQGRAVLANCMRIRANEALELCIVWSLTLALIDRMDNQRGASSVTQLLCHLCSLLGRLRAAVSLAGQRVPGGTESIPLFAAAMRDTVIGDPVRRRASGSVPSTDPMVFGTGADPLIDTALSALQPTTGGLLLFAFLKRARCWQECLAWEKFQFAEEGVRVAEPDCMLAVFGSIEVRQAPLSDYYMNVLDELISIGVDSEILNKCEERLLENTPDDHPNAPTVYTTLFKRHMDDGGSAHAAAQALHYAQANPDMQARRSAVHHFVRQMVNEGRLKEVVQARYKDQEMVIEILEGRARGAELLSVDSKADQDPGIKAYHLLFAMLVRLQDYRRAAAIQFELGCRLSSESFAASKRVPAMRLAAEAFAAANACFRLLPDNMRWIAQPQPADGENTASFDHDPDVKMETASGNDYQEAAALNKPAVHMVTGHELHARWLLAHVRYRLSVEHRVVEPRAGVGRLVALCVRMDRFTMALQLCCAFGLRCGPVVAELAQRCVELDTLADCQLEAVLKFVHANAMGNSETGAAPLHCTENAHSTNGSSKASWSLLRSTLEDRCSVEAAHCDKIEWCRAATERILALGQVVPLWLVRLHASVDPSDAVCVLCAYGHVDTAFDLLEYLLHQRNDAIGGDKWLIEPYAVDILGEVSKVEEKECHGILDRWNELKKVMLKQPV